MPLPLPDYVLASRQTRSGTRPTARPDTRTTPRIVASLPQPGDVLAGKYRIVDVLGEGGMGVVYLATHVRLHQRLAVKVLRPDVTGYADVIARFEREARITAQLRSSHTARVIDVDRTANGLPIIVMEYLEGRDLDAELQATGPLPVAEAVDIVLQVADAIGEAHALGIVHRDLKPSNLFVCHAGGRRFVKVLDFGISKIRGEDAESRITRSNAYLGTPYYAAPEQLRAAWEVDGRSDVWSLGAILFELLTGRAPFTGSLVEVIAKVISDPVPSAARYRPDLPAALVRVISRAMQRDPARRYATMSRLTEALSPFAPKNAGSKAVQGHPRLGEILVGQGLVSQADLDRALAEQRRSGKLLGRVLLDMGLVEPEDLMTALAMQQGIADDGPSSREQRQRLAPTMPGHAVRKEMHRRMWIASALGLPLGVVGALVLGTALGLHPAPAAAHQAAATQAASEAVHNAELGAVGRHQAGRPE